MGKYIENYIAKASFLLRNILYYYIRMYKNIYFLYIYKKFLYYSKYIHYHVRSVNS